MQETITLKISMKELENVLLNHYKKIFNEENLKLIYSVEEVGDYYKNVKISIIRQTKVGTFEGEIDYQLNDKEIRDALNDELEKSKYKTKQLNYIVMNGFIEEIRFDVTKKKENQKKIGGIK